MEIFKNLYLSLNSKYLNYLLGFSLFFYTFGFNIKSQIFISVPMVLLYIFTLNAMTDKKCHSHLIFLAFLVILYTFLLSIVRTPLIDFAPSFIPFSIGILALTINFEKLKLSLFYIYKGVIISAQFMSISIIFYVLLNLVFSEKIFVDVFSDEFAGNFLFYQRPILFFVEPAHLGMALVTSFFVTLNFYKRNLISITTPIIILLAIFFTGAISAIFAAILTIVFSMKRISLMFLIIIIFSLFLAIYGDIDFLRTNEVRTFFTEDNYGTSASNRLIGIRIITDFFDNDLITILAGVGFSDYHWYFKDTYSHISSNISHASIANTFAMMLVSLGLIIFLLINFLGLRSLYLNRVPFAGYILIFTLFFTYGTFVNYYLWLLIFLINGSAYYDHKRGD